MLKKLGSDRLAVLAEVSIVVFVSLLLAGFCNALLLTDLLHDNVDLKTHYRWVSQIHSATSQGVWLPRWFSLDYLGLGQPAIPPLPFMTLAVLFSHTTGDVWLGMKVATYLIGVLICLSAYFSGKWLGDRRLGWMSVIAVSAMPYIFFQITLQAAFNVYAGLPWLIWFAAASIKSQERGAQVAVAVSLGCLIFSHPLTAFIALVATFLAKLYTAVLMPQRLPFSELYRWSVACVLGLCLGAGYLIPAVVHMGYMHAAHSLPSLDWKNSFVFPFFTASLFGTRWSVVQWVYPSIVLLGLMVVTSNLKRIRATDELMHVRIAALCLVSAIAFLLSTELAFPLYVVSDTFKSIQWPYRFQLVASVTVALSLAMALSVLSRNVRFGAAGAMVILPIAAGVAIQLATGYMLVSKGTQVSVTPSLLQGSFGQPENMLRTVGPKWREYALGGGLGSECIEWSAKCAEVQRKPHERSWMIDLTAARDVRLPVFFHPGWDGAVNGQATRLSPDPETGVVKLPLAAGRSLVTLTWHGLQVDRWAWLISGFALLLLLTVMIFTHSRRPTQG